MKPQNKRKEPRFGEQSASSRFSVTSGSSGTINTPADQENQAEFHTLTPKPVMKSKGIHLILALILVLPSEYPTLQNITETVRKSLEMAFSALSTESFAATTSATAYAAGPFEGLAKYEGLAMYDVEERELVLPLSRPGETGRLNVNIMRGSVEISGYDGDDVVVRYDSRTHPGRERQDPPEGMRRISGSSPGFHATEDDNVVDIRSELLMGHTRFNILVPRNFSINAKLMQAQTLTVSNISGDLEIGLVSGEISLMDISGAAVVNSVNGNIVTVFESISEDKPMSFNTLTGDIDLSFPTGSRFTARLRSEFGDMFTDFDMEVREETSARRNAAQGLRIAVSETVIADVNGGGPEYRISTLRGNIYIRQN